MQLYNISLTPSTAVIQAVSGNFSAPKAHEVVLAKSRTLQLYNVNEKFTPLQQWQTGPYCCRRNVLHHPNCCCGQIPQCKAYSVRLLFATFSSIPLLLDLQTLRDWLLIGTDSGKTIILEFNPTKGRFIKTHEQTFGKSGCRRIVPGQYLAVDPRGRAFMVAAVEKQKFVYVLERNEEKLLIKSPHEAHKSQAICAGVVALDVGSENATFVCLEMDYGEVEDKESPINTGQIRKSLIYYQMDFGMNTVIRKKEAPVDRTAHLLIAVPNAPDGPGGVVVMLEDFLLYRGANDQQLVRMPARKGRTADRRVQFTTSCTYRYKGFFFLICSELGDIFKVDFLLRDVGSKKEVVSIKAEYFETISCSVSLCLTKNGFLFCASEKDDHQLFLMVDGEAKTERPFSHSQLPQSSIVEFEPVHLQNPNLVLSDSLEQYGPMTDLKIVDLKNEGNPQIYALNASGSGRSYLRIIKQGLKIKELLAIPYVEPKEIWCFKTSEADEHDKMIVITLAKASKTLVLTTTPNGGFAQTSNTGLQENATTLFVGRLKDDSIVQILETGFRHLLKNNVARTFKFEARILKGLAQGGQMALAMAGGALLYYEIDETGSFSETSRTMVESAQVVAMAFSPHERGRVRASFLAVAFTDYTVRIFELSNDSSLKVLSMQNMKDNIESISIAELESGENQNDGYGFQLFLYTGLQNGMIIRTSINTITGKLTDSRPRYLGSKPVKCIKTTVLGQPALLALSSRPWLIYTYGNKPMTTLLAFPFISVASQIMMANGLRHTIMVYSNRHLRFLHMDSFGSIFHSEKVPIDYSGKRLSVVENCLAILESDLSHNQLGNGAIAPSDNSETSSWCSQISIYCPCDNKRIDYIKMETSEVCISMCYLSYTEENKDHAYIVLGCVKDLVYHPMMTLREPRIKVYQYDKVERKATFFHETVLDAAPLVLSPWKDKVLAGVGTSLRAYEIGKKQMLKKAEAKGLHSPVNTIRTWGERIYVTELNDSFHMYKFKAREQTFQDIADDILNRYVTATAILDYHTVIGADKFENIFVSRVPPKAEEEIQNNPNSYRFRWENGYLNGAPFKMDQVCSFYVGQIVTALEKASLVSSGDQVVIYSTINGGIGALCPFETREDVDFFTHLELYLRHMVPSLSGRDHLAYRSYYTPCKAVIDGDLCETFNRLTFNEQVQIAKQLDHTPHEIQTKLEEIRNRLL